MKVGRTISLAVFLLSTVALGTAVGQTYPEHSVLAEGNWWRLTLNKTGICKVTTADIPGLAGSSISSIAVYGNGGGELPAKNDSGRINDLQQLCIEIADGNGNGIFDGSDYLLFYAEGTDLWKYNTESGCMEHQRHPYAKYNYYYVTNTSTHSKNVAEGDELTANSGSIATYTAVGLIDNDIVNTHETGQTWVGEKFSITVPSKNFTIAMPSISSGSNVRVRAAFASITESSSKFILTCNGSSNTIQCSGGTPYYTARKLYTTTSPTLNFNVHYTCSESLASGYLDYIEVNVTTPLTARSGQTEIYNLEHLGTGNISQFVLSGCSATTRVWDVSRHNEVKEMRLSRANSAATFTAMTEECGHFIAFDGTSFTSPSGVTNLQNQDLHGESIPDMVIVTNPLFKSQANELADLHLIHDGLETLIVTPQEVYNEFSSGKQDPIAIREMMRMFRKRALQQGEASPKYLLIIGRGTYDNKDILNNNYPTVVTCQSAVSFTDEGGSYATDDMFGYLDDGESGQTYETLELGIGRLPARSQAEATWMVDKIRRYMERSDLPKRNIRGDWRNYIAMLADDADPSCEGDTLFASSSEHISQRIKTQFPQYNIDKIYADAYSQQSGAIGSFYPDVNNALKQRMDYGCLLLNYIGHGSVEYIGTERYISASDINNYENDDQLTFFVTSTCSYGRFDQLSATCGGEMLLTADGGAIAVVTAARPIGHIESFDADVCINAITPGNTLGDALRLAKNATSVSHSFVLLGDPALKLSIPQNKVVVTQINGKEVNDGSIDSAEVLSEVTVRGEIQNANGQRIENFEGQLYPIVFDRPTNAHTLANDNEGTEINFSQQNSALYKGRENIENGRFEYTFIVPRDVAYKYDYVKLSHFAKSEDGDMATGSYHNLMCGGFDQDADITECRPNIRLYMNDSTFRNGGITDENPAIFAILEDKAGINSVGSGIGHDLTAIVDNNPNNEIILNDFYETDLDNSKKGYITYRLADLSNGTHSIRLKAWNIYNYSNEATITFTVHNSDSSTIGKCFAYPNPASTGTTIHIEHNTLSRIESATVNIYNSCGQKVKTITPSINAESYVMPVYWDFRTDGGTIAEKGVYVVRIDLKTDKGEKNSSMTKIVKIR